MTIHHKRHLPFLLCLLWMLGAFSSIKGGISAFGQAHQNFLPQMTQIDDDVFLGFLYLRPSAQSAVPITSMRKCSAARCSWSPRRKTRPIPPKPKHRRIAVDVGVKMAESNLRGTPLASAYRGLKSRTLASRRWSKKRERFLTPTKSAVEDGLARSVGGLR